MADEDDDDFRASRVFFTLDDFRASRVFFTLDESILSADAGGGASETRRSRPNSSMYLK